MADLNITNVTKLHNRVLLANQIYGSDIPWPDKYSVIFGMKITDEINDLNLQFHWDDPDQDYEDDVRTFMDALNDFQDQTVIPILLSFKGPDSNETLST